MSPRRKARYHKSTRGCKTCKIRRVKCDETLPFCLKCTSTGRSCEGPQSGSVEFVYYNDENNESNEPSPRSATSTVTSEDHDIPTWSESSAVQWRSNIHELPWSPWSHKPEQEQYIFHSYIQKTAPVISGEMDDVCWRIMMPQMALQNDVIWNGILTIGALWDHPVPSRHESASDTLTLTSRQMQAFRWYDKAIVGQRLLSQKAPSIAELILTSAIFSTIELQRGGFGNGFRMLHTGFSMLAPLLLQTPAHTQWSDGILVRMYMRSACLYAMSHLEIAKSSHIFQDMAGAQETLFSLMFATFGLLKECYFSLEEGTAQTSCFAARHTILKSSLHQWKTQLDCFQEANHLLHLGLTSSTSSSENSAIRSLMLYHDATQIWLQLVTDINEDPSNNTGTFFHRILTSTDKVLELANLASTSLLLPAHFFDMTILPPLYMVAVVSTDLEVRSQALGTMQTHTAQKHFEQVHGLVVVPDHSAVSTKPAPAGREGIPHRPGFTARRFLIHWDGPVHKMITYDKYADVTL